MELRISDFTVDPVRREIAGSTEGTGKMIIMTTHFYVYGTSYNSFSLMKDTNSQTPTLVKSSANLVDIIKEYNDLKV